MKMLLLFLIVLTLCSKKLLLDKNKTQHGERQYDINLKNKEQSIGIEMMDLNRQQESTLTKSENNVLINMNKLNGAKQSIKYEPKTPRIVNYGKEFAVIKQKCNKRVTYHKMPRRLGQYILDYLDLNADFCFSQLMSCFQNLRQNPDLSCDWNNDILLITNLDDQDHEVLLDGNQDHISFHLRVVYPERKLSIEKYFGTRKLYCHYEKTEEKTNLVMGCLYTLSWPIRCYFRMCFCQCKGCVKFMTPSFLRFQNEAANLVQLQVRSNLTIEVLDIKSKGRFDIGHYYKKTEKWTLKKFCIVVVGCISMYFMFFLFNAVCKGNPVTCLLDSGGNFVTFAVECIVIKPLEFLIYLLEQLQIFFLNLQKKQN